jgi:hypothetical protein
VNVASDERKTSSDLAWLTVSMAVSLISRAVSQETTSPALHWPSSMRLATSTTPLRTPRQAFDRS